MRIPLCKSAKSIRRPASGFTLVELVISAALMTLILVSAYLCLSSGVAGQKLIDSRVDAVQSARAALALMTADLRAACPLSKKIEFLGANQKLGEVEAGNLDFGTRNYTPKRAREADFCEVSYFLKKDKNSGNYSLWRRRDASPDPEPLDGGAQEEIARNVHGLKFEYYDGLDWYDEWGDANGPAKAENSLKDHPNMYGLPEAVRITLSFDFVPGSKSKPLKEGETAEPPLVFQTVARLNLAPVTLHKASSSYSSSGGSDSANSANPAAPGAQPGGPR